MASGDPEEYPKHLKDIPYSDASTLNTLDLYIPRPLPNPPSSSSLWLIYLHGGAYRDPLITSTSFTPTHTHLARYPLSSHIAAYASINYRLSPYPSHPTHPSNPADPSRNALHPDHITDVLTALHHLQTTYGITTNYILAGHSVGATLAFQVAMKRYWGAQYAADSLALEMNVVPPVAIVGVEGIYNFPALLARHKEEPVYRDFVVNALGADERAWRRASPFLWGSSGDGGSWEEGRVVVVAHSEGDGLVEGKQADGIFWHLIGQGWRKVEEGDEGEVGGGDDGERRARFVELEGDHDEVWQTGETARAIEVALRMLLPP